MKRNISTDKLLTMGLALYADKRSMEQRVRGIFGRYSTAGFARVLAVLLCLIVLIGGFTTACVPGRELTTDGNATATDGNAYATDGNARAAQPADEENLPVIVPPADPIGEFLKSLRPAAAFVPITAPSRVIRNPESISDGVMLTYDASVTIPEASAYAVTRVSQQGFSEEEIQSLRGLFDVPENPAEGQYSGSEKGFYYNRYDTGLNLTRKTWVHYEQDWHPDVTALFDEPNPLARAETQAVAEKALADMGAVDYVLDSVDEAIVIGSDADGKPYAISRGWEYTYVRQSNGLPRHDYGSWSSGYRDPAFYYCPVLERLWLYIDEQGVSRVDWSRRMQEHETIAENVALISLEEAITLANERFERLYSRGGDDIDIRIQNIRLAAMLLANDREAAVAYSVPVWEFEYSVAYGNLHRVIYVLPFNAVDGGTVLAAEFPF